MNGYAGTEPPQYAIVRESMKEFPSDTSIALLRSLRVRYVLLHLRGFGPNRRKAIEDRLGAGVESLRVAATFGDDLALEVVSGETVRASRY